MSEPNKKPFDKISRKKKKKNSNESRLPCAVAVQMFQVIQYERALYIQANNCVEARDWIDILTKVSQCNHKRLSTYHPSAYLNGHWLCCKLSAEAAPGCTPCTGCVDLSQKTPQKNPKNPLWVVLIVFAFALSRSCVHLFLAGSQPTSSWMWTGTERPRGSIPSTAHT